MYHTSNLNSLIEKTTHFDKDERYMATNDIMKVLQQDINIDDHTEARICTAVLKQLDDRSNDVQGVAVKCLGILVKSVHEAQISQICIRLCDLVLNGSDALRDVYSIGLKTLMSSVPTNMGDVLVSTLTSRLLVGSQHANDDIKRECLDSLTDLLKRFGHLMKSDHETILTQSTPHLINPKGAIQKRAVVCLSTLSATLSDSLLYSLMDELLSNISAITSSNKVSSTDEKNLRVFIQTAGRITRAVGHRLGGHVARVVPQLLQCLGDFEDERLQTDAGNELRENCYPGLESFILRCPRQVATYVTPILTNSLEFMKFDPNYCYDDDEDEVEEEEEEDEDEYDEDYDDGCGSDDDDSSWKVRKAALRVILAIIRERDELLEDESVYTHVCDELLGRFKEREESVQLEVFGCVTQLFEETIQSMPNAIESPVAMEVPSMTRSSSSGSGVTHAQRTTAISIDLSAIRGYLESKLPFFLRTAKKLLRGNSLKLKSSLLLLLRRLVAVMQGSVPSSVMDNLMGTLLETLHTEHNQTLKLDCLTLLMDILKLYSAETVQRYIPQLLPEVFISAKDEWYKLVAASLNVLSVVITTARPLSHSSACGDMEVDGEAPPIAFDLSPYFQDMYDMVHPRLEALDQDQEIKEASISCAGQLVGMLGDVFPAPLTLNLLHLMLKRLENEVTRIAALRSISFVASSPIECGVEIFTVLSTEAVKAITPFLRQQSRLLKQTTLSTLSAVMSIQRNIQSTQAGVSLLTTQTLCDLLKELSQLLLTSDMNITDLGLQVIMQLMQSCPSQVQSEATIPASLRDDVLPKAIELAISPLLQGGAQESLINLLSVFFNVPQLNLSFNQLKQSLMSYVDKGQGEMGSDYVPLAMQSISNLAKCIAGLCKNSSIDVRCQTIIEFLNELDSPSGASSAVVEARRHLALLCIGRMGEDLDVSSEVALADRLKAAIMLSFEGGSEEVRAATAFALGRLAVGSMSIFLPIVLDACTTGDADNKHQYLLLVALKETIVVHVTSPEASSTKSFAPYLETVLPGLLNLARSSTEEGVRNMVAECLGALASIHADSIISLLRQTTHSEQDNKLLIWTVVTSMRYFFSRVSASSASADIDAKPFLMFLQDEDIDVRRATLLMINAAVHYTPRLVQPHLDALVLPHLLQLLSYKQKREVQMGPFKHIIDDALPLRKGALTCYETMMYVMPDAINPSDLLEHLTKLVVDNLNETNLQCHQILCKLCSVAPSAMLCAIEGFIEPLQKVISKYEKMDAAEGPGGPEKEKALEQVRSCVRLISCVNKLENLDVSQLWLGFASRLQQKPCIAVLLAEQEAQGLREKGM